MKKAEVLKYCAEKAEEGYLTHLLLLDIYSDEDEIPDEMVNLICHLPEPPKPFILFGSAEMIKNINEACEGYLQAKEQEQIGNELKCKISKS